MLLPDLYASVWNAVSRLRDEPTRGALLTRAACVRGDYHATKHAAAAIAGLCDVLEDAHRLAIAEARI